MSSRAWAALCFAFAAGIYVLGLVVQNAVLGGSRSFVALFGFWLTSLAIHAFSAPFLVVGLLFRQCRQMEQIASRFSLLVEAFGSRVRERLPRPSAASAKEVARLRIFLASSSELATDRDIFELDLRRQNDKWIDKGLYLELVRWENFLDAMSAEGLQAEYNRSIGQCDVFVALFGTKVGVYTRSEFQAAWKSFLSRSKPAIYTYFKDVAVQMSAVARADFNSIHDFRDALGRLGHYPTDYRSADDLLLHFRQQMERLLGENPEARVR